MQVLESTDKITPKSVLRHRPIGDSKPPRKRPILSNASTPTKSTTVTPIAQRASRANRPGSMTGDHQHDIPQWQRAAQPTQSAKSAQFVQPDEQEFEPSHDEDENRASATRILPTVPKTPTLRSSPAAKPLSATPRLKPLAPKPNAKQQKNQKQQAHPLLYLGIGMLSMVVLWTILSGVIHWANVTLDDLRYGRPRTAQYDVVVGHSDSAANTSHFIVINLNRRIEVIEFPGGDPSHAHIYMGPQLYGPDDDLTPATLSFVDVNGDHKLDMIINVQQSHIVFINDQGTFRQPTASERHQIDLFLQRWKP